MKKYEINKYPPSLFKDGRFLREDWGVHRHRARDAPRILDKAEYLRVEGLYVAAVANLARTIEPELLRVHDVEFWETASYRLADLASLQGPYGAMGDERRPCPTAPIFVPDGDLW